MLLILFSCKQETKLATSDRSTSLSIEEQIIQSYQKPCTIYNDTLKKNNTLFFNAGSIHATADFTGDEISDYFVIEEYMGGPTSGHFHCGKTGKKIAIEPGYAGIISKPGIDIYPIVVDVDPGDKQKELMILCGGGGTLENRHYLEIYRFDKAKNKMKQIFSQNISMFTWDDELNEQLVEVNYISAIAKPDSVRNKIYVFKGQFADTTEPYNLNIIKSTQSVPATYIFDKDQNMFIER